MRFREYAPTFLVLILAVSTWQLLPGVGHQALLIATPLDILDYLATHVLLLWSDLAASMVEIAFGLLITIPLGVGLAIIFTHSKTMYRSVYPLIVVFQVVPTIVIAPALVLWFGFGPLAKIILAALTGIFPVVILTLGGLGSIDSELLDMGRLLQASRMRTVLKLELPAALPQIFTGLRLGVIYALIGAVVAEFIGASEGIGIFLANAYQSADSPALFAGAIVLALVGSLLYSCVSVAERLCVGWNFERREA